MTSAAEIKSLYAAADNAHDVVAFADFDELTDEQIDAAFAASDAADEALIAALVDFGRGALPEDDARAVVSRRFAMVGGLIERLAA